MVRDRGRVPFLRVTPASEVCLLRGRGQRSQPPGADHAHRGGPLAGGEPHVRQVIAQRQGGVDVALDVEVAGDVGAAEPQLTRRGDDALEGGR